MVDFAHQAGIGQKRKDQREEIIAPAVEKNYAASLVANAGA